MTKLTKTVSNPVPLQLSGEMLLCDAIQIYCTSINVPTKTAKYEHENKNRNILILALLFDFFFFLHVYARTHAFLANEHQEMTPLFTNTAQSRISPDS